MPSKCERSAALRPRLWALAFVMSAGLYCQPSAFVYHENVLYNFSSEGFLAPGMLQTMATLPVEQEAAPSLAAARAVCVKEAAREARRRAVRVMLHTRFDLPGQAGGSPGALESDYPFPLSERDYIRGEIAFDALLERGYIALQDLRLARECTIVFRIKGRDLPDEIRAVPVRFRPEGLKGGVVAPRS